MTVNTLKIACLGDVMCGDSFYNLGYGAGSSLMKEGISFLNKEIVDHLKSHDIVMGNIECVLSDVGRDDRKLRTLHMRGRPETAEYLAGWGINVAHLANNHIMEHGLEAALNTVENLQQAGINIIGAGKNHRFEAGFEPVRIELKDHNIILFGACLRKEKYAYDGGGKLEALLDMVRQESLNKSLVIVSVHWGDELMDRPALWQHKLQDQLKEAGASLIIGHHPHVFQGVSANNDSLTAYSMGNFIFDNNNKLTQWSGILSIQISENKIIDWKITPIVQHANHYPVIAEGDMREFLQKECKRRCELLQQPLPEQEYEESYRRELEHLTNVCRRKMWWRLIRHWNRFPLVFWPQILMRPLQRRLGTW